MLSKRVLIIVGILFFIMANIIILSVSGGRQATQGFGRIALFWVAPFQEIVTDTIRFCSSLWQTYFTLATTAQENTRLKRSLRESRAQYSQLHEIELSNERLRTLLGFQSSLAGRSVAAEVIGTDPSQWYKAIIINKGRNEGLSKGMPVVVPEGVAGQVTDVSSHYAKVMLIIDRNSAVDALVQRTRARGIIKGESTGQCLFEYVLRKEDVQLGDRIVTSGLDGVFPKGQPIGVVTGVLKRNAGIFQEVVITPYANFEKLEEVLVVLNPHQRELTNLR
jgi:rod shape-determining protein MreC